MRSTMDNVNARELHMQQRKGKRLVIFPLPLQGHINPMLQLANILYMKGFSITIIHTKLNSPNSSSHPYFTFYSIPDGLSNGQASLEDVIALHTQLNVNCVVPFGDCLVKLLSDVSEEPISCLITDAIWHFSQDVAKSLNLPRLVLRTSSVCSFLAFAALPDLSDKGYLPIKDSGIEEPVAELPILKMKDLPYIKTRNPENFYELLERMARETRDSSGLIWNSFEDLEQAAIASCREGFAIPNFPIGPFHKFYRVTSSSLLEHDQSSISWLDKQAPNSVLYVSFGSVAVIDELKFLEIAWGLADSEQPFLWVVRPRLVRGSEWLEPLPDGFLENLGERGHIVKWAPQLEVLAHPAVGGFWTHSGWNSTLESICEGVPMICSPCFGDQMVNSRYVSDLWRIGIHLENRYKTSVIKKAIKRLMVEIEGQELRQRIMNLKEKVEICLRQGGSSFQALDNLVNYISKF